MKPKMLVRSLQVLFLLMLVVGLPSTRGAAQDVDTHLLDSDGDGISDWDETNRYWSDPYDRDSDEDGIDDYREVTTGTSPIDTDSDGDHFSDTYEYNVWNPQAVNRENKYHRCPYIADLPSIIPDVDPAESQIVRHYYFQKGNYTLNSTLSSDVSRNSTDYNTGWRNQSVSETLGGHDLWGGIRTQRLLQTSVETSVFGLFTIKGDWQWNLPWPYLSIGRWDKGTYGTVNNQFWDTAKSSLNFNETEDKNLFQNFTQQGWDLSKATIILPIAIENDYDRVFRLDNMLFNMGAGTNVFKSQEWEFSPIVINVGESYSFVVSFEIDGEEWLQSILLREHIVLLDNEYFEASLYSESDGWLSQEVIMEDVTSKCVLIELEGGIREYVTATGDKIDGLTPLVAFDRLFLEYDFRFGRLISLEGHESTPGEAVWIAYYFDRYFEMDEGNEDFEDFNLQTIRMWGRGGLKIGLQLDSDADWLPDDLDPNDNDPDSDNDYADDYVEFVIMKTDLRNPDTDGGRIPDGIEYFEGLDPHNASDDMIDLPEWYLNHPTLKTGIKAANILLEQSISPESDQLTWEAPTKSSSEIEEMGSVFYAINDTIYQGLDNKIHCIEMGDVDNDAATEVVIGTYPLGLIAIFDMNPDETWSPTILYNFSDIYGDDQVKVWDVDIGDANNDGIVDIVVGTWYEQSGEKGDVYLFYKGTSSWNTKVLNPSDISGGVHSVEIGDVYNSDANAIVVGQGGSESFGNSSIFVYSKSGVSWNIEALVELPSSMISTCIGDFGATGENKIVYCTNALNSTIGFVTYDSDLGIWDNSEINTKWVFVGDSPPFERYTNVQMASIENPLKLDLYVGVDSSSVGGDSIEMFSYPEVVPTTIVGGFGFSEPTFHIGDVDNDMIEDICYHELDMVMYPNNSLVMVTYNSSSFDYTSTIIENVTEPYIASFCIGDIDNDFELELLYGTTGNGYIRQWDHPANWLWPSESLNWMASIEIQGNPTSIGTSSYITVVPNNIQGLTIYNMEITCSAPDLVSVKPSGTQGISYLSEGQTESIVFELIPKTQGNYSISIYIESEQPCVTYQYDFELLARTGDAYQAQIGDALLDLGLLTNNETIIMASEQVANWLHAQGMRIGDGVAWNYDANLTEEVYPGYVEATADVGRFFLKLFRTTGETYYLSDALLAARFLRGNASSYMGGLRWSQHLNGIAEAADVGMFLDEIQDEIGTYFFSDTIDGIYDYIISQSTLTENGRHWFNSIDVTQTVLEFIYNAHIGHFFQIYFWLCNEIENNEEWLLNMTPGIEGAEFSYPAERGVAGLGLSFAGTRFSLGDFTASNLDLLSDRIVEMQHSTSEGSNWEFPSWTTNSSKLAHSVSWSYGAAGIVSMLSEAYKYVGNQSYLETALNASTWIGNCIDELDNLDAEAVDIASTMAGCIKGLVNLYQVIPVITVGYFVDPMTSVEEETFTLTGYVQVSGYFAEDIALTAQLPGTMLLDDSQTPTLTVGEIRKPGVKVVNWEVSYISTADPAILYGTYELTIEGSSSNAGSHSNMADIIVTDLGVSKVGWEGISPSIFILAQEQSTDELFSVGLGVQIPIRVEYYDGTPAINASVNLGQYSRAVVNASGYAYGTIIENDVGTVQVPVSLEYDKNTGIRSGHSSQTLDLTFTSLEVFDVDVSSPSVIVGQSVVISGNVRYMHNQTLARNARVSFGGLVDGFTDESGRFQLVYTGDVIETENYTVFAFLDSEERFFLPVSFEVVEIEWISFWNPLTIILFSASLIGIGAIVCGVAIRYRKSTKMADE